MTAERIYLDYQATTPVDPRVLERMLPWFTERFGNPHSRDHAHGWDAAEAVEAARGQVAALIGATAKEIVFTSGATESNNLAIKGVALAARRAGETGRRRIVTVATEHKCVLESCHALAADGFEVTVLPVDGDGLLDLQRLSAAVDGNTLLVSVMAVNNEIGVLQPLAEIGRICRAAGAKFHTDAAQAAGKIPLDANAMAIDLMSISGHKMYGPKGIGALYVRRRPKVEIAPLFDGGGQERGLRAGTLAPPLCVGLGVAAEISGAGMAAEGARLLALRSRFLARVTAVLDGVRVNGDLERRLPGNLNLSFAHVDAQDLMMRLDRLSLSSGSACTSAIVEPSHVIRALGVETSMLHNALRFGFGRPTTEAEIDAAADAVVQAVRSLRAQTQVYQTA
ncbi:MAG: cysteine desulfurase family protein [Alphaproteobacteria bacterium]